MNMCNQTAAFSQVILLHAGYVHVHVHDMYMYMYIKLYRGACTVHVVYDGVCKVFYKSVQGNSWKAIILVCREDMLEVMV